MERPILGVIGGSGLYDLEGLSETRTRELDTPFGKPSGPYLSGRLDGAELVFLPRHGPGHVLLPGEVNSRANIHGFRQLGVRHLLAVSAVGSLREDIRPGDMVLPSQLIDRTRRVATFFGEGAVAHVQFGDPTCPVIGRALGEVLGALGVRHHKDATYVCMEGPAFSTRAESNFYRSLGADVIGMTALPEAKLAREAEICYAILALSTDYDCWHASEAEVSVDAVVQVIRKNVQIARQTISAMARSLPLAGGCRCQAALEGALLTDPARIPAATRERLRLIAGRLFEG